MLDFLLILALGVFLGWQFPQPPWAIWLQEKVFSWFKNMGNK